MARKPDPKLQEAERKGFEYGHKQANLWWQDTLSKCWECSADSARSVLGLGAAPALLSRFCVEATRSFHVWRQVRLEQQLELDREP